MNKITSNHSQSKIIIIQPAVPKYRLNYFNRLSEYYGNIFSVYAANEDLGALTAKRPTQIWEKHTGPILKILPGLEWQVGMLSIEITKSDIVVICGAPRCLTNIIFLLKARFLGAKTVWWGHFWSASSKRWRFILRTMIMRLSNFLLFYTDKEVEEYLTLVGSRQQPAFALNNGISTEDIQKNRVIYNAKIRGRRLLFIGRITAKSELDVLINALANSKLKDVILDVIGDGQLIENFQSLARKLGVENSIKWHGAITEEVSIAKIANQCSIFVYPGGVGLSLIHAMAYGLPAILHSDRYKHMPEIAAFKDGVTGLSFHHNDPTSLAETIDETLQDCTRLEIWSSASIEVVERSFNTKMMSQRFIDMINKIDNS